MWFAFAPRGYMSFTTLPAFYYNHLRALNYNNKSRFYILFCFFFRRVQNQVHGQSKPAYICHGLLVAASPIPSAALYLFLFLADFSPPDLVSSNQNRHVTPHWNLVLNCEMLFMRASLRAQRENLLLHPAPFAIRSHACRVPCAPTNKFPPVFGFLVLFFSIFVFCSAVFFYSCVASCHSCSSTTANRNLAQSEFLGLFRLCFARDDENRPAKKNFCFVGDLLIFSFHLSAVGKFRLPVL